ncbi:MAG: Gfo/Idh/MocA family oxidoreductase [Tateyamaria sp.]|jgi:predicted dehydrogenase|nr:Gfo/Idh/MocA family oxidoreductase [Tateyamaria sp.]MDG1336353.1 Gfo/Idh/MocA family oxidoreductase [Tateyamaria sp.]MDG2056139.1 Gfo/Idh/MocA family oxidoreductase [Tateyamaria sp.]
MTRIGVAGAGLIGKRHMAAINRVADVTLSAVLDPVMQDDGTDVPLVADLDALAAHSDGVILAVPNALHAPMAIALLEAGCPVLVEKPLAGTAAEGAQMVAVSERTGVPLLVGHHRRHNPLVAKAKEIIESGLLGPITAVHGHCWLPKPDLYYENAWRQGAGAGPLFINLIHDIDVLMHLCGPIEQVQAFESNAIRGAAAEEVSVAILRFASGALGTVNLSDVSLGPWSWELTAGENPAYPATDQSSYVIGGRAGSLALPNLTLWNQSNGPDWWAPISTTRVPFSSADPLDAQIAHFADVIRGTAKPLVTGADGLRAVRVIEAIKAAALSGSAVSIAP